MESGECGKMRREELLRIKEIEINNLGESIVKDLFKEGG
jgi:hypothetical protein